MHADDDPVDIVIAARGSQLLFQPGLRSASQRVNEAIEAVQELDMPLDTLGRWTRQALLQALAAAFLVGVIVALRR